MQSRHIRGTGLFTEAFMAVTGPFMGSVNAVNSTWWGHSRSGSRARDQHLRAGPVNGPVNAIHGVVQQAIHRAGAAPCKELAISLLT